MTNHEIADALIGKSNRASDNTQNQLGLIQAAGLFAIAAAIEQLAEATKDARPPR